MRVAGFDQERDQLNRVNCQAQAAEIAAEFEVAVELLPFGECIEVGFGVIRKDGVAEVEEVDAAIEAARAGLRAAVCALGQDADGALVAGEEGENLRGFAKFGAIEANASVGSEGHGGIIYGLGAGQN